MVASNKRIKLKKKLLFIIGTRPEIIKLFPLYEKLKYKNNFDVKICFTGQHNHLINQHNDIFKIKPNYSFNIMHRNQSLFSINQKLLKKFSNLFKKERFDAVCVQGDTNSAMVGALSAFYKKIKVVHVEAGLRTFNKYHPFPEEINRDIISCIADINFAPTCDAYSCTKNPFPPIVGGGDDKISHAEEVSFFGRVRLPLAGESSTTSKVSSLNILVIAASSFK